MSHDLFRQGRRLMKTAASSNFGQRHSSHSARDRNVIRLRNVTDAALFRAPLGPSNHLLIKLGARMHATSVERGDGCAIAMLDHRGVVHAWHDSLPGATVLDFRIIGSHVSQFYLPQDVALLRPNRSLIAACLHGSDTQQGWHRRPDGSIFWGVTVIEPMYLESGELNGYSHVTRFAQNPRGLALAGVNNVPRPHSAFHGAIAAA